MREAFASVRRRPKMHLPEATLAAASSYVMGYWHGQYDLLRQFQEWMGPRYGGRAELMFWVHIACEIKGTSAVTPVGSLDAAEQLRAVDRLFELLDAFLTSGD